ncbi:MAG: magnesium and cobalt transport protein CorA [Candidatus Margulisiibacteriota bacterium]|nr:MAG: magnesium and cobalt transport protein CorA [Candidatus Margulisbacteria bacterium GWD2_39_127]OGI01139.1 MAG: magnesium and cobalt transport protein CorA [Candidatus Margulisbacteria bacterium GWF2_38_17]OGI10543.1 MAG: magnesium and cobalt transport protein CorA [Candidatus Margulisbacteria bacterium GWE2_39_32]PZM78842.1 MAG: magnesium and cobalt transport protein CorA [Candidatus Margulisiibacteriota bacterium]HAR64578.1 magnesium and cobalt transport protein CorA [Candidatus Margul
MHRFYIKKSKKIGLPPGTPIHLGEKKTDKTKITLIQYDENQLQELETDKFEKILSNKNDTAINWINIDGVSQIEIIEIISKQFGLHPLTLEDIASTGQRPKIEDYGDYIFLVLKTFYCDVRDKEISSEQISIILGSNFVISFQERSSNIFDPIKDRIRQIGSHIRKKGADYLVYSLLDTIVDNYFLVLEESGDKIENIERILITNPEAKTLRSIYSLKREIMFLRKSVWPLREVCNSIERLESPLISQSTKIYLRDVYDHSFQIIDTIETFRDMLSNMLDIYLSSISNKMNEIMKVLTIISTIFIPLTFIAGVYGMNFENMPELHWKWGYYFVLFFMAIIVVSMIIYFRRKKWF